MHALTIALTLYISVDGATQESARQDVINARVFYPVPDSAVMYNPEPVAPFFVKQSYATSSDRTKLITAKHHLIFWAYGYVSRSPISWTTVSPDHQAIADANRWRRVNANGTFNMKFPTPIPD
ncbi:hypothetical protein LF1_56730 [Rubripirellula obstinata]|uniref:Uncharacterized protein n=1 Tax=Rubripirellula obstinata TaxID=406547 RepID=A0A5B1CAN5_9BACT|nr:hypothetical protein LF1_56730 [Rubripirellula obstinata]